MNQRGPGLVDAVMLASITADLSSLIEDGDVSPTTITVKTPTGPPTVDWAAATSTPNTDDDTVSTLRHVVTLEEVSAAQGGLQLGDITYLIMADDVSSVPTVATVIVDGSDTLRVLTVATDPLSLTHSLLARRSP